ncbi:hypothetical protein EAH79_11910 [Sphingomonas koreensis]|nr:hypothetical protein EAH79_11910 [Sphingomonas koreensis]
MNKSRSGDQGVFALKYGAVEGLLVELTGGRGNSIVTRFRKLRPKFAADGLLSETGGNVSYDLTRILAICATYELNALSIPQGSTVEIVVANWPEIARGCLTAWHEAQCRGPVGEKKRTSVVRIYIDALNGSSEDGSWASILPDAMPGVPHLALDCRPMVDSVTAAAERSGQSDRLAQAFVELESTFGWDCLYEGDPERLPRRKNSDFFGTGPYFERARVLLAVEPGEELHRRRAARLQAVLDYLEMPAPIDSWKRFVGTEPGRPRLVHMLAAWGVGLKLKSVMIGDVATIQTASLDRAAALDLIRRGEEHVAKLVEGTTT